MEDVQIFSQWTPNPNAYKFITSEFVKNQGKATFSSEQFDEIKEYNLDLVEALLSLEGVVGLHLFENVITLTQDGSRDWGELSESVETAIRTWLPVHDPDFVIESQKKRPTLTGELAVIDKILSEHIRPALQADGGDVEVVGHEDRLITIKYEGACGDCPSSMQGTLQAIKNVLAQEYRADVEVVAI